MTEHAHPWILRNELFLAGIDVMSSDWKKTKAIKQFGLVAKVVFMNRKTAFFFGWTSCPLVDTAGMTEQSNVRIEDG